MKISYYAAGLALLSLALSCTEKEVQEDPKDVTLLATLENGRIWNTGDEVEINGSKYTVAEGGSATVELKVAKAESYCGAYDIGSGSTSGSTLSIDFASVQNHSAGIARPMVASNKMPSLSFKNLLGELKLNVTGDKKIKKVVLSEISGTKLAGTATVSLKFSGMPSIVWDDTASSNVLTYNIGGEGLQLGSSPVPVSMWVPAGTYGGFKITMYDTENGIMLDKAVDVLEIKRGETVSADVVYEPVSEENLTYLQATMETPADKSSFVWKSNMPIYVNGAPVMLRSGEETANGEFGPVANADKYYASTSSASVDGITGSRMRVNIPVKQSFTAGISSVNPAAAASSDNNLAFKYLAGVVSVKVSGPRKISSLELQSAGNDRLAGEGVINLTASDFAFSINANASKSVTVDCGAGVDVSAGQDFNFVIPAGEYADGFVLILSDVNGQQYTVELQGKAVSRNEITSLGSVDWEAGQGDDDSNLSRFGSANSYMVHLAGDYKFRTRKVDNSNITGIAKVDWLWATKVDGSEGNALVSNIKYNSEEGTVSFTASDKKGNVLIAAFNNNDEIVWSWHIWLTDVPATFDFKNNFTGDGQGTTDGYYVMDRNLGATAVEGEASYGLLYQWGRKDPFISATKEEEGYNSSGEREAKPFSTSSENTVCNTAYSQAKWESVECSPAVGSVANATAHPMQFIYGGPDSNQANWLHFSNIDKSWNYEADKSLWRPFQKSVYDPCPPGYQIPRNQSFAVVESRAQRNPGKGITYTTDAGETVWFPFQGYRSAHPTSKGAQSGVAGDDGYFGIWNSELMVAERAHSFTVSWPLVNNKTSDNSWGDGFAVRCVKAYK